TLPNVNGVANADAAHTTQVDLADVPYKCLPQTDPDLMSPPLPSDACSVAGGDGFNSHFPNEPFLLDPYIAPDVSTIDPVHRFYQHRAQINGGRNDRFVAVSNAKGLVMGYHDSTNLPFAAEAVKYTIGDNFFQAAYGGSFLNHQWLICACTPEHTGTTTGLHTVLGGNGIPTTDAPLTPAPEKFAVNTMQPSNTPNGAGAKLPLLENPTIGDRLTEAGISWAWYSGGWDNANSGSPGSFTFHHQPFNYYRNHSPGTPGREHLRDETEFLDAARDGTLPAVSFVKPIGIDNEHPGNSLVRGQQHTLDLVEAVRNGPNWKDTMIVVTYDENGGYWDHVPPPAGDRWGPGTRIPMAVVSPFARQHHVDHTVYDTTSILATIERRWGLAPL
ncbi:MAG: alkaline phosphatase family protein, partial [Actinomycetota bacterium]